MDWRFYYFVFGIFLAVIFRASVLTQKVFLEQTNDDLAIQIALNFLGLIYLICGTVAFTKNRNLVSFLFFWHCFGQVIHWGGPLSSANSEFQTALWFIYLTSSMFGVCALLNFSLVFSSPHKLARNKLIVLAMYLPVLIELILSLLSLSFGSKNLQNLFLTFHFSLVNLIGLVTIIVFAVRYFRENIQMRRQNDMLLVLLALILGPLPYLLAAVLGIEKTEPYTLGFVVTPILISMALVKKNIKANQIINIFE